MLWKTCLSSQLLGPSFCLALNERKKSNKNAHLKASHLVPDKTKVLELLQNAAHTIQAPILNELDSLSGKPCTFINHERKKGRLNTIFSMQCRIYLNSDLVEWIETHALSNSSVICLQWAAEGDVTCGCNTSNKSALT